MSENYQNRLKAIRKELKEIKAQRKQEKRIAKEQNKWIACSKSFPDLQVLRVIAWANNEMIPCWYAEGNFYTFDGTWMYSDKNLLSGVTHWMPKDWMYVKEWPLFGPGLRNRIAFYWSLALNRVSYATRDLRPKSWGKNAQISKKVVYFRNEKTGEIRMGLPESFPATTGFHKIVCNSAHEAEVWSDRLRQYNISKENRQNEERERIEGAQRDAIRSHMHHVMANSRNNINREFVRRYLDKMDKIPSRTMREEYNHAEGYEEGR